MYFSDLTIEYGENEALHLLALEEEFNKMVNSEAGPLSDQESDDGEEEM